MSLIADRTPDGDIEPPGGLEDALKAFKEAFTQWRAGVPDDLWRENLEHKRAVQEELEMSIENGLTQDEVRETAPVVLFDTKGRLLLQLRDDLPKVVFPGMIGLFVVTGKAQRLSSNVP